MIGQLMEDYNQCHIRPVHQLCCQKERLICSDCDPDVPPNVSTASPSTISVTKTAPPKPKNKGIRPRGTTKAAKVKSKMNVKLAHNWVCLDYADAKAQAGKNLVEKDLRERLVIEAKIKFRINGNFDVPRTTILQPHQS